MRTALLLALLTVGCDRGRTLESSPAPAATGSLVFDVQPEAAADVFLATEAEIMRSRPLLDRARTSRRIEIDANSVRATRRPGSMILDVSVRDADPRRAAGACNAILEAYFEQRLELSLAPMMQQEEVLAAELDAHPDDAALKEKLQALELRRRERRSDVRILEPCIEPRVTKP